MGKVAEKTLEELKDRVDIVELISAHLELKPAGNTHKGLCPFHNEKTPSFSVDRAKGFYHCFGCGASGDTIAFVMERQNLSFVDAVESLCDTYGIEFVVTGGSSVADRSRTTVMRTINEELLRYACKSIMKNEHADALNYILNRGFTLEIIQRYQIGFVPDNITPDNLNTNFPREELIASGVFAVSAKGRIYSPFYGRIVFPIRDVRGNLAGFSGRIMDNTRQPKYLNSKDSIIFRKSSLLYNFHNAKNHKTNKRLLIVEGYFDVMRMDTIGYGNVVATMGTAITPQHVVNMKKYFEEFTLVFDGDEAGQKAALKSLPVFVQEGVAPMVAFVPNGQDPDDYIVEFLASAGDASAGDSGAGDAGAGDAGAGDGGAGGDAGAGDAGAGDGGDAMATLLKTEKDLLEYAVVQQVSRSSSPNESHKILAWAGELVQSFPHAYHREHYAHLVSRVCNIPHDIFVKNYMNFTSKSSSLYIQGDSPARYANHVSEDSHYLGMVSLRERDFLAYLLLHSSHDSIPLYMDGLQVNHFYDTLCREFYQILQAYYTSGEPLTTFFTRRDSGKFSIIYTRNIATIPEANLEEYILNLKNQLINSEQYAIKTLSTTLNTLKGEGLHEYGEYSEYDEYEKYENLDANNLNDQNKEKKLDPLNRAIQLGNEYIELVKKRKRR